MQIKLILFFFFDVWCLNKFNLKKLNLKILSVNIQVTKEKQSIPVTIYIMSSTAFDM